ncbi:hypothetical protein HDU99_007413 [Rhizoclosmatium hyalinum]|nr:hypothetical protein HDU99_007413 [Rhizoclosmatium hyalinum]
MDSGFIVEAGGTSPIAVRGHLFLTLERNTEIDAIPNFNALVTVHGVVRSGGGEAEVVNVVNVVYDSTASGPFLLTPYLPFNVNLGTSDLVPSHGQLVEYTVHAAVTYSFSVIAGELLLEAVAPLLVLPNERIRALLLASQALLAVANGNDAISPHQASQDIMVNFVITVARRVVLVGDEFIAELNVASSKIRLDKVVLSLQSRTVEYAEDAAILGPLETLAFIEDVSLSENQDLVQKIRDLAIDSEVGTDEVSRLVTISIPMNIVPSIETSMFGYQHHVRLEFFSKADRNPIVMVDIPVVVVQRGSLQSLRAVPQLLRNVSLSPMTNEPPISQEELESMTVGLFVATRTFRSSNHDRNELTLNIGEIVEIK